MCQLNLYCLPKTLGKKKAEQIAKKVGFEPDDWVDCHETADYYRFVDNSFDNCDSFVSMLKESSCDGFGDYTGFEDFKKRSVEREIHRLEEIKEFMLLEGYAERRKIFDTELEKHSAAMEASTEDIRQKEIDMTDAIMLRTDIPDGEKSRLMHETVYPVIGKLLEESDNIPAVKAAREAYAKFIDENRLMWDSWGFTLEKAEPQTHEMIPLTSKNIEILRGYSSNDDAQFERGDEPVFYTEPSNNIFDRIEATKNRDFTSYTAEFEKIKTFAKAALEHCDHIKLVSFWQGSDDDLKIAGEQMVSIENLTIDKLLFLPYLTTLKITKAVEK